VAVAFDTFSAAAGHTDTPTTGVVESWSHTCTGSDRLLLVGVAIGVQAGSGGTPNNDSTTITVTYNGVSMTDAGPSQVHANGGTSGFVQVFYLVAPATGANTVSVTSTGYNGGSLFFTSTAGAMSFTGVDQASPLRNVDGTTGNSTSASNTVTAGTTNEMVFDFVGGGSNLGVHNQTTRWVDNQSSASQCGNSGGATAAGSASTVTMTRTLLSDSWANIAGAIQSAGAAAAGNDPVPPLLGPGSQGPMAWQWQQTIGVDPVTAANDVNVTGLLELGGVLYATGSHDAGVAGLLATAEYLSATVTHDATVTGLLPAAAVPYTPISHDTSVAGLVEFGVFALSGDPSSNLSTVGLLFAGLTPLAIVTHTATVAGLLPAGTVLYSSVSHAATLSGHLPVAGVPYAPVSHTATVAGLLELGAVLFNGPTFDYNVAGWLPLAIGPRSTITADRTVAGLLPGGVSIESTITTTRSVAGLLEWGILPSGLITRTTSVVGYLPSGLVVIFGAPTFPVFTPSARIFHVAADNRRFPVPAQDRTFRVPLEDRTADLAADDRIFRVPADDRTDEVP
jgi:hypothetical protein